MADGIVGRPPLRGRLTPAEPLGDEVLNDRPTRAPVDAGVGLEIPARRDPCCVQWFAVQRDACDVDDADTPDLTERQLRVPDAP